MDEERFGSSPLHRVDGQLKVSGAARYAAEQPIDKLAYGVLVQSTIAKGRVRSIDTLGAATAPGVITVLTHMDAPRIKQPKNMLTEVLKLNWKTLQDNQIDYAGQNIAVVVATTREQAEYAATLLKIEYDEQRPLVQPEGAQSHAIEPDAMVGNQKLQLRRGDAIAAFSKAATTMEQTYTTPIEHHNPIELASTIAIWEGDTLTLYATTRGIDEQQQLIAGVFGMRQEDVRIICPFIGGSFGSKILHWEYSIIAAMAAKRTGLPVKIELTRAQMFTSIGYRPHTQQQLTLAATPDGQLSAIRHATLTHTSPVMQFVEPSGMISSVLYTCPNLAISHKLVQTNLPSPIFMRAPGESSGSFALESAMDELAVTLAMDPVELRLRNHADTDPRDGKPWSGKHLKECYAQGTQRFGWQNRNPTPRSMRDDDLLVGWGMATATYPGMRQAASAQATLHANGEVVVCSATHEQGSGVYTMMTQLVAETLGIAARDVRFELGDSNFPQAPITGGSWTTTSVGSAVVAAAEALKAKLIALASKHKASPLHGAKEDELAFRDGRVFLKATPAVGETFTEILTRNHTPSISVDASAKPGSEQKRYAFDSFGALFVEVTVDPFGQVRVRRVVGVYDVGRVLNPKLATSQIMGGITFGIGMALMEQTVVDTRTGRFVTASLAEYEVPTFADSCAIDVSFINQPDPYFSPMGARGAGEIGIVGVAAAIANAVYHATGTRVRDLPITPDKLM